MSYEIRADYSQQWLFPPALADWVPADHPARFVGEFVDALDLKELGFRVRETRDGRPSYAADLLLKVVLYGYINGIRRLRRLEKGCRENVALIWLTGRNAPDHNTLWRFWRDNRRGLRKLFKVVVRIAARNGLVDVVLHAVDGTKIAARGSLARLKSRGGLEKELAGLDAAVEEVMKEVEAAAREDTAVAHYELPEGWREKVLRREEIRELLGELEASGRSTVHEQEREAHTMKTRQGGMRPAYNAQAVAESRHGLIIAQEVITEETDNHCLVAMIDEVAENLGETAAETVADNGYYSGEELEKAEERQYGVVVCDKAQRPQEGEEGEFHSSQFAYDAQRDCLVCPQGKELLFAGVKPRGGDEVRVYRCKTFRECPVRWKCSKDPRGRSVGITAHHQAMTRQRQKQHQPEKRKLLARRRGIIEPVFGIIKAAMGFERFGFAGQEGARTEWAVVCSAFDLRKIYPLWRRGELSLGTAAV